MNFNHSESKGWRKLQVFTLWKCEFHPDKRTTSFDVELNALSNCAIRKERLCREKQEKMKKLKILWISTRVNQRVEENFKFSRPKCDASNKRTTSFDVELNALSNCAIRKERLCREKQEKMKKLKILWISTTVNQRVEENFKFSRPKCDASNKRTTSFDVELNALSNCAIRKERLCREKQEKIKKLKILSICTTVIQWCRRKLQVFVMKMRISRETEYIIRCRIERSIELCH